MNVVTFLVLCLGTSWAQETDIARSASQRAQEISRAASARAREISQAASQRANTIQYQSSYGGGYGYNNGWGNGGWGYGGVFAPKLDTRQCLQMGMPCPGYIRINLVPLKQLRKLPEFAALGEKEVEHELLRLQMAEIYIDGDLKGTVGEIDGWNNRAIVVPPGNHEIKVEHLDGRQIIRTVYLEPGETVKVTPYKTIGGPSILNKTSEH